ncbi:MAG: hypothetical protein ACREVI_10675 [Steroidobacteraceae bacterium]
MIKSTLTAAALAMLLAGPAFGDDDDRRRRGHDRDDRYDHRDHDGRRDRDWRDDHRRHDDRRASTLRYDHWRSDHSRKRHGWRHVPPVRHRADFGYRSGYELAWRDWIQHGRHDRHWRRWPSRGFGGHFGYQSGYEAGWQDAARYYDSGYRRGYWARDPRDGWYFGFHIDG